MRFPKTSELVARDIRRRIIHGDLKDGDCLPRENELLANIGISRPTLREAIRILEAEQLLTVTRGSRTGARVHRPRVATASRFAGYVLQSRQVAVADILQARLAIEPFCVAQLAESADEAVVEELLQLVSNLNGLAERDAYGDWTVLMAEFHRRLVVLSGNKTLALLTEMLGEMVETYQLQALREHVVDRETRSLHFRWGARSLAKLLRLIGSGDVDSAVRHWTTHLLVANRTWVELDEHARLKVVD